MPKLNLPSTLPRSCSVTGIEVLWRDTCKAEPNEIVWAKLLRRNETLSRSVMPARTPNAMVAVLSKPNNPLNPASLTGWLNRCPTKKSTPPAFCGFPSGKFTTFDPKNAPSRAYGSTGTSDEVDGAVVPDELAAARALGV